MMLRNTVEKVKKHRSFVLLWSSQIFSQFANNALNFALTVLVYSLTHSSTSIGLVFIAIGIPAVLFGSVAGVFSDRMSKKNILVVSCIARAFLMIAYFIGSTSLPIVLITTFVISTFMQLFAPAEASLIALLIPKKSLMKANSLFSFSYQASVLLGYTIASLLIAGFPGNGYTIVFGFCTVLFLLAGISCMFLIEPTHDGPVQKIESITHLYHDLIDGWKETLRNPLLARPLLDMTAISGAITFLFVLAPALVESLLQQKVEDATPFVLTPASFGIILGLIGLRVLGDRLSKQKIIAYALFFTSLGMLALPMLYFFSLKHALLFCVVAFITFFNPLVSVPAISLLQEHTHPHYRGRVFGVMSMLLNIIAAFPAIIIGILTDMFGVRVVMIVGGLFFLSYTLIMHGKTMLEKSQSTSYR